MLRTNLFVLTARSNNSGLSQQQKNRRPWPPAKLATQFNLFKVGGTLGGELASRYMQVALLNESLKKKDISLSDYD